MDAPQLSFNYYRRFGAELEVNSFDGLDRPTDETKLPEGIFYIGNLVAKTLGEYVEARRWGHTHWGKTNGCWVIKPDGSCGMEVCSPISKGWYGIERICRVADAFAKDPKVKADRRCSLHLHVEVNDLHKEHLANIITYWIKCEPVMMDSVPNLRKNNRYCQFIGLWDWLKAESLVGEEELINLLGKQKYLTLNTYHLTRGNRATIEFRIAENIACLNSYFIKNWIRLVLHFVEAVKNRPRQRRYVAGDPWSSFLWLDPIDVCNILGFNDNCELSSGMKQVRNWFLARLYTNTGSMEYACQSQAGRVVAQRQVAHLIDKFGIKIEEALSPPSYEDAVYNKIYSA